MDMLWVIKWVNASLMESAKVTALFNGLHSEIKSCLKGHTYNTIRKLSKRAFPSRLEVNVCGQKRRPKCLNLPRRIKGKVGEGPRNRKPTQGRMELK